MRLLIAFGFLILVAVAGAIMFFKMAMGGVAPTSLEKQYMTAADRFIRVEGARVRIREQGAIDAPVIILVHGFTFSLETWDAFAKDLALNHRVISYDLLGHGLTGPDAKKRYAPPQRSAFLGAIMDALKIERATLIGNSLGGLTAWRFAALAPERVEKLVLIDAPAFPFNGVGSAPVPPNAILSSFFLLAPQEGVLKSTQLLYFDDSKITDERLITLQDMMRRKGNGQAFIDHLNQFTMPDPRADLARVTMPTLIMWGVEDMLIPPEHGAKMVQAMPNADLILYDQLGHVPHEEDPARLLKDLHGFLAEGRQQ